MRPAKRPRIPILLVVEQFLNGLQFGLLLFLLAAGLTLVFGIMDLVNLAHGSLYMMGAYFAATFVAWTGSFVFGIVLALGATLLLGIVLEFVALRHLCSIRLTGWRSSWSRSRWRSGSISW